MDTQRTRSGSDTPYLYALSDLDGTFLMVSPSHVLLGYQPEGLVGQNAFALVHPDDLPMVQLVLDNLAERKTIRFRYRRQDGTYIHLETVGHVIRDEQGQPELFLFRSRIDAVSGQE